MDTHDWIERERMLTMLVLAKHIIERFVLLNARHLPHNDKLMRDAQQFLEAREEGHG